LFEECLKDCPPEKSQIFLMMFADYEENFGLLSHAMDIYERATNTIIENLELWNIFLSKVM
jgi:pre-mRNA-splicing factor SYF1